uniref:Serpin domain-containing protein n=1 Tax=Eptatretus burgeri TaxID=7764 RepID=A0A8C4PZF0_EPTBU
MSQLLGHTTGQNSTNLAARIFFKKDVPLLDSFLEKAEKFYSARPTNFVADNKANLDMVNAWVAEKTENMIKEFLTELSDNTDIMLLSAIYFKGRLPDLVITYIFLANSNDWLALCS